MIEVKSLKKAYRGKSILDDVSVEIKENDICFFMGKNGAGKTTLVKCLTDLESYKGEIRFNGKEVSEVKNDCIVVWDDCPFYTNLSGIDNIKLFSEGLLKKNKLEKIMLKYFDKDVLKRKVKTYSYGQKKKLALVLVEILKPKYLIMDEISNGLDYETMRNLKNSIIEWSKDTTIILTGHQFDFYKDIVRTVYVIKDGKIKLYSKNFRDENINLEEIYDKEIYEA